MAYGNPKHMHQKRRDSLLGEINASNDVGNNWDDFAAPYADPDAMHANARSTAMAAAYALVAPEGFSGPLAQVAGNMATSTDEQLVLVTSAPKADEELAALNAARASLLLGNALDASTTIGNQALPAYFVATAAAGPGSALATAGPLTTSTSKVALVETITSYVSAPANTSPARSDGSHSAAKAIIAIGVLAAILVLGMAVFFVHSRRKRQKQAARQDDEKAGSPGPEKRLADGKMKATAPRLSMRFITQMLPICVPHGDGRASGGAIALQTSKTTSHKPGADDPFTNEAAPANPFGNHAEQVRTLTSPSPIHSEFGIALSSDTLTPPPPISSSHSYRCRPCSEKPSGAGATAADGGSTTWLCSKKLGPAHPLELAQAISCLPAGPASPAPTEVSMHSVASGRAATPSASAAVGGPPQSSVYRVEVDFKPSLDDELGLGHGQLIRVLHEYDDGWALCIRLDNNEQGVCPRSCLSAAPATPRPPPANADSSPMTLSARLPPQGRPTSLFRGASASPAGGWPMIPVAGASDASNSRLHGSNAIDPVNRPCPGQAY